MQIRVVVACHDETDLIDADEDLLAGLLDRDALGLLGLRMQLHVLAHADDGLRQAIGFDRLHQVIDGVDFERVQREFAVGGNEHDRRRELQVLQGFRQLQARCLGHVHVKEHDVAGIFFQLLNGLTHACCLGHHFGLTQFVEQEL